MMEAELMEADIVVPSRLSFKKIQAFQKYPKGQTTRRWKHLKQILQADNYPPDLPNCKSSSFRMNLELIEGTQPCFYCPDVNIESPPSTQPCKRICDITGYEV